MMIKIGDRLVECDNNRVIKATSKEIRHPDGRIDVEIHVPSLKIHGGQPFKNIAKGLSALAILSFGAIAIRNLFI